MLVANLAAVRSVMPRNAFARPERVKFISEGPYAGDFLVQGRPNRLVIVSPSNEVRWQMNLPFARAGDIAMVNGSQVLICDYQSDRLYWLNLSAPDIQNSFKLFWDAHDPHMFDWTAFIHNQSWKNETKWAMLNVTTAPDFCLGITSMQYIPVGLGIHDKASVLLCCQDLGLILELEVANTSHVIWTYGGQFRFRNFEAPSAINLTPEGFLFVCSAKKNWVARIVYPEKYTYGIVQLKFPQGNLAEVGNLVGIDANTALVASAGAYGCFRITIHTALDYHISTLGENIIQNPAYIDQNESSIVVLDASSGSLLLFSRESYLLKNIISNSWKPMIFALNWGGLFIWAVGVMLLDYSHLKFSRKDLLLRHMLTIGSLTAIFAWRFAVLDFLYYGL